MRSERPAWLIPALIGAASVTLLALLIILILPQSAPLHNDGFLPTPIATAISTPLPTAKPRPTSTLILKPTSAADFGPDVTLGELVTAQGVGPGNTPVDITSIFTPDQIVYAVVEALAFGRGHSVFSRWYVPDNTIEDTREIIADRDYNNTYLEFHIEEMAGHNLPSGRYTVVIYVDGQAGPSAEFIVR